MYKGVFYRRYILGEWCGAEGSLFVEPPKFFKEPGLLYNGIAHIDASYGGGDYTAFTCARRMGDVMYMYGKLYAAHVDTVLDSILADCDRLKCAPIYCETNADKGYLQKEIRRRGAKSLMYAEYMNKYVKISTFGQKWWENTQWLDSTDAKYIGQIMDYTVEAEHDDAPDSMSCCARLLDRTGVAI